MSRDEIANFGGQHALALCGLAPFGDCQSIRHRLDMAAARLKTLEADLSATAKHLGEQDWVVKQWRSEVRVWKHAIIEGNKLLARELGVEEVPAAAPYNVFAEGYANTRPRHWSLVPCPYCRADVAANCIDPKGRSRPGRPHASRVSAARRPS